MENGIIDLQGSRLIASSKTANVLFGLKGVLVWSQEDDLSDAYMTATKISYGHFCSDSDQSALIQQHDGQNVSKFTLSVLANVANHAPSGQEDSWAALATQYVRLTRILSIH